MKIIEPFSGVLTNFEVLKYLKSKGAGKDATRVIASVAPPEYKVYDCLVQTPACNQTSQLINEFVVKCKEYDLTKAEIINIVNIRPPSVAGMDPIIEKWDDRLGEEKMDELVETTLRIFPPIPEPKENDHGEATDNGIHEDLAEMNLAEKEDPAT